MAAKNTRTFTGNTHFLKSMLSGLDDNDMLLKTGESNTIGWILGHITWTRGSLLKMLNEPDEIKDWEKQFVRGVVKNTEIKVNLEQVLNEFSKRGEAIVKAIEALDEDGLKKDIGFELPGGGRDIGTFIAFAAWHETFHMGQIDLIRAATGKGGIK